MTSKPTTSSHPILVSHKLCPYVQRAAIVLAEKGQPFERRDVDLQNKPDWFLAISPLGKTPLLLVDDQVLFESAVICEYLDDIHEPRLHPDDALSRARHRAWMAFGSEVLNQIAAYYNAPDESRLRQCAQALHERFKQLESTLADGPYFAGSRFGMVDVVFAPVFRYFDVFDTLTDFPFWSGLPKVRAWREALRTRPSVISAADPDYARLLRAFIAQQGKALSTQRRLDLVE